MRYFPLKLLDSLVTALGFWSFLRCTYDLTLCSLWWFMLNGAMGFRFLCYLFILCADLLQLVHSLIRVHLGWFPVCSKVNIYTLLLCHVQEWDCWTAGVDKSLNVFDIAIVLFITLHMTIDEYLFICLFSWLTLGFVLAHCQCDRLKKKCHWGFICILFTGNEDSYMCFVAI